MIQILTVMTVIFLMSIQPPADLDLGWHLRYGEYFFKTGQVLKDNIFSIVWPDYKWVQASWGYDLIAYWLYSHFSFLGMSVFAGIVTLLTFLVLIYPLKKLTLSSLIILAVIFLTQTNQMYIAGLRSQTLSTLFFTLTLVISSSYLSSRTSIGAGSIFILPFLFWLWANLHGGFSLGLGVISLIWLTQRALRLIPAKPWLLFGAILALSFLTPLINPWGLRIYEETFKHSSNTNLTLIKEWMPFTKWIVEATVTSSVILLVLILGWMRKKVSDIPYLLALILTTYLAFNALKFVTVLGVMLTFYLAQIFQENKIAILSKKFVKNIMTGVFLSLFLLDILFFQKFVQLPTPDILHFSWSNYCQSVENCSEGITKIMLKDPPKGNGFNPYGMGGYLIFRVPQVKVFVDGRMAAWEENGQTPPVLESATLNSPYSPVVFRKLDSEYKFQWVIINNESPVVGYLEQLRKNGAFEKRFQDDLYSYYVKKAP